MNAGIGHHSITDFQYSDQLLLLFLPLLLRSNHDKIHDDENENKRDEKGANAAAGHGSRRSRLSLSENYAEHMENWRAHLKHERARCNCSFASLVLWRPVCLEPWLLSVNSALEQLAKDSAKTMVLLRQLD